MYMQLSGGSLAQPRKRVNTGLGNFTGTCDYPKSAQLTAENHHIAHLDAVFVDGHGEVIEEIFAYRIHAEAALLIEDDVLNAGGRRAHDHRLNPALLTHREDGFERRLTIALPPVRGVNHDINQFAFVGVPMHES